MRTTPDHRRSLPGSGTGPGEVLDAYSVSGPSDYMPVGDYLRIVLRRWWIIAVAMVLGVLAALWQNWRTTPVYEASATLQIGADPNVLGIDRPMLDLRDWMREFVPTQLGVLASAELARLAQAELTRAPDAASKSVPAVEEIAAGRTVAEVKDTRLVTVGFASPDPVMAAAVANALARSYVQLNLKSRSATLGEASDWLTRQVEQQRKLVQASETALQRYREEHGADALFTTQGGTEERQNIIVQQLADLQGAVTKARADTIEKEAQYKQAAAVQGNHEPLDSLPAVAANAYVQGLKTELTTAERELAQASKELGERHPERIKLQAAVQNAERKLQSEIATVVGGLANDLSAAKARERALTAALDRQKAAVQALNAKSVEYTALEREATSNRDVLDKLLQRSREAALGSELQSTNVRIVDPAQVPAWPIYPRKQRNILLGLAGSGALAVPFVFLLELLIARVTSPDDVRRHLRISTLGVVPSVKPQDGQPSLLAERSPSQFTELLNAVRTNLVLAPGLSKSRTLLVTSAEPGDGKTMMATNLAVSLARLNQRVLLIDADLRRPRLHEVFNLEQQPGLTDVLTGGAAHTACHETAVPCLSVMPAGNQVGNPTDLLGSARFSTLVDRLRQQFDWVLFDTPPVLAVTDPCLVARVASGVLFVVGSGQTTRSKASAAVERLEAVGANFVGAVLNRVVFGRRGQSYLPYYHQDYSAYLPQRGGSMLLPGPSESDNLGITTRGGSAARSQALQSPAPARDADRPSQPRTSRRVQTAQSRATASPVAEHLTPNPWDI